MKTQGLNPGALMKTQGLNPGVAAQNPGALAETVAEGLRRYVEAGAHGCPRVKPHAVHSGQFVVLGAGQPGFVSVGDAVARVCFHRRPDAYAMRWRDALRDVLREIVPEGVEVK